MSRERNTPPTIHRGNLPEHELSIFLASRIRRFERWLAEQAPEDLYQEVALFLLEHCPEEKAGVKIDYKNLSQDQLRKISNAFQVHLVSLKKAEGSRRNYQKDGGWERAATSLESSYEDYDQSRDPALADHFFERYNEVTWYSQHIEICQKLILESGRQAAEKEWTAFQLYIAEEYTPADIGMIMKCTVGEARRYLANALALLKEKAELDHLADWKISESNNLSREFRENRPRLNAERIYVRIDPNEKLTTLVKQYGVTKPTAGRMRERAKKDPNGMAWYVPDYLSKNSENSN